MEHMETPLKTSNANLKKTCVICITVLYIILAHVVHPKLHNINLHNITHSVKPQKPREQCL